MEDEQLDQGEANMLVQSQVLQISEKNVSKRPNQTNNPQDNFVNIFDVSSKSPKKSAFRPMFSLQSQQLKEIHLRKNSEKQAFKISIDTSHKLSLDKSQSLKELSDFSLDVSIKSIEKEIIQSEKQHKILVVSPKQKNLLEGGGKLLHEELSQIQIAKQQQLYLESSIKDVKRDLQIRSKGKICKSQDINIKTGQLMSYKLLCKNTNDCPFDCSFEYSGLRNSINQKLYKLVIRCLNHMQSCIESQQQISYMKLMKKIDLMQSDIKEMLQENQELKPKQILIKMAEKMGQTNHKFIYKGLADKNYHKAAKKYFDNLIYKIKSQMGIL